MSIIAFGDSLTAVETYVGIPDKCWYEQIQIGPFPSLGIRNFAFGGSVSGAAYHWAYALNGVVLESLGLLGQIERANGLVPHTFVIWSGTNDLIVASQLDPFLSSIGLVTTTPLVTIFRNEYLATHSPTQYAEWIITKYTMPNLRAAIRRLKGRANVVVVNYFALDRTPLAASHQEMTRNVVNLANTALRELCKAEGVYFADVSGIDVTTFDEVHLDHKAQTQVLACIRAAEIVI